MASFYYRAKNGPQNIEEGLVDVVDRDQAIQQLLARGLTPIEVYEHYENRRVKAISFKKKYSHSQDSHKKVSTKQLMLITRQFSDLLSAAVPILRSVQLLRDRLPVGTFKNVLSQMAMALQDGSALSVAMRQYPKVFSPFYVNIIHAGELSGKLDQALTRIADHLEKEHDVRSRVFSGLMYPALILSVGILTVIVMVTVVIPRLTVMFEDLNQSLPWITMVFVNFSAFVADYFLVIFGVLLSAGIFVDRWIKSEVGRRKFDKWLLSAPYIGDHLRTFYFATWSRTLGSLLENGVTLVTALNSARQTIPNSVLKSDLIKVSDLVADGASLQQAIAKVHDMPHIVMDIIVVGEESGDLDHSLVKLADMFERDLSERSRVMVSLIGPILLIIIVGFVLLIVLAMLLPILEMNTMIQ